jgi:Right handed beta helix region
MQKPMWFLAVAVLAIVALITPIGLNRAHTSVLAALPPSISITSCNPTFNANTAGGSYIVTANLTPAAGMNCIVISAPGVTLNLNHFTLTGTGSAIGIDILPGATGAHVVGGTITLFTTGLVDNASSALLEGLTIRANTGNGLIMKAANGSVLDSSSITGNGANGVYMPNTRGGLVENNFQISGNGTSGPGYGVWIQNNAPATLSNNNIIASNNFGNGGTQLAAVWVGASQNAPQTCASSGVPSTGNIIVANKNMNANAAVGIGIECPTATKNTVADNQASKNVTFDLFDGNTSCDANNWVADTFGTANQVCVH